MSHIEINYVFLLFWSILGEIHRKNLFLVKKVTFSERRIEKLRNLFNLIFLIKVNPEENLDLFKQLFLIKPVKGDNIKKNKFLLKASHLELNYTFLLFWCILGEIQREALFLVKKGAISERRTETLRKFVFLNMFVKGQILRKIWICLNNFF